MVTILVVGKLKNSGLIKLENHYLKLIQNPKAKVIELKSNGDRPDLEAKSVLSEVEKIEKKSAKVKLILLDERGQKFNSRSFAQFIQFQVESGSEVIFAIGGSSGHHESVKQRADALISLSELTFPHRLARILLAEQLYRAQMINLGHPYHKD